MIGDARAESRLRAYRLMEALQGHDHGDAAEQLAELQTEADAATWPEVSFLASLGRAMDGVIRPADPAATHRRLSELIETAESMDSPALLAEALGLRAVNAATRGDTGAVLADAGRGIALLDDDRQPPLDACTALIICAAAYNSLSIWELVDELYDRAAALCLMCEEPIQAAAVAVNRILIRLEWAGALLESGDDDGARIQLMRAATATDAALLEPHLPLLWRTDVAAARTALTLYLEPPADPDQLLSFASGQRELLRAGDDLEMLPLYEVMVSLALLNLGRPTEATKWLATETNESSSSGARSLRLWATAKVVAAREGNVSDALAATLTYGTTLAAQRLEARSTLLAAARSRIESERLTVERTRLARDVGLDALTGLSNRRAFDGWLAMDLPRPKATALLILDVDDFKSVNDQHGSEVGDEVLRRIGRVIARRLRVGDQALRLSGDEFAVIVEGNQETLSELATSSAERVRALQLDIATESWAELIPGLAVTVTIGLAVQLLSAHRPGAAAGLYDAADRNLYARRLRPFRSGQNQSGSMDSAS